MNPRNTILSLALGAALLGWSVRSASAQVYDLTLSNPNWNITVSHFGYSDLLLDNTPGFQGREYLSGEWGAAVGYTKGGSQAVAPMWLQPQFIYPDWTTNSQFQVVTPAAIIGQNAAGLDVGKSVIASPDLQITQTFEMLDTVVGMAIGTTRASAGGAGSHIDSNRYVFKQTYEIKNVSDDDITHLQLFQLLHGLESISALYDNRTYTGPLGSYRYDVTEFGDTVVNGGGTGADGNPAPIETLRDYIGFSSSIAPDAFEIGRYGSLNAGDNHGIGKPSVGVHLSIEQNWTGDTAAGLGNDSFAPVDPWVAGGTRWTLGNLAQNQSVTFDVVLSILTGTVVGGGGGGSGGGGGVSGGANGGSGAIGGVDFHFEDVNTPGSFFAEYSDADENEINERIAEGEFEHFNFALPGLGAQLWNLEFDGEYTGPITLTFNYDPLLLDPDVDPNSLQMWHYSTMEQMWELLGGIVDPLNHTITITTNSLSPFILGFEANAVPEPASAAVAMIGLMLLAGRRCRES